jgi:leucyl aminopeptidase (aminopeptidase T)
MLLGDTLMNDLEQLCRKIVKECVRLDKKETCLLVKDLETSELHHGLEAAIHACGGIPWVLGLSEEAYLQGPLPREAEATMTSADVVLICTRKIFPHKPRKLAAEAGARVLSMCTVTKEIALRALDVDYDELSRITRNLADALSQATEVLIRSQAGTEIRMAITGQPTVYFDGLAREPGKSSVLPAGVVATAPLPETAEGKVVVDGSIASIGLLENPVTLTVKGGRIEEIQGNREAEALLRILESADENARCIAEVGLGTNPKATYIGNLVEDERVRGSGHIGLGRNVHLGGTIESSLHMDATIRKPSIYLDGETIASEGNL